MHGDRPHQYPTVPIYFLLRPQLRTRIYAVIAAEPLDRRTHDSGAEVGDSMPVPVSRA
jgi:hypothetical protein